MNRIEHSSTSLRTSWRGRLRYDVRFALRSWSRTRGVTAVVVLTLALGVGATTAIFSVVNGVVLRPLPYANPERLVRLVENMPADGPEGDGIRRAPAVAVAELETVRQRV